MRSVWRGLSAESRAGLKPVGAFVILGAFLAAVGVRLARIAAAEPAPARAIRANEPSPKELPRYALSDRNGAPLALSHAAFALEASPFNLWLAHTPEVLDEALARALALPNDAHDALMARLYGYTDGADELRVSRWPLTSEEALAVADWLAAGGPRRSDAERDQRRDALRGLWVESCTPDARQRELLAGERGPFFELAWKPEVLLSRAEREAAWPELATRPNAASAWVRALGADLHRLLAPALAREAAHAADADACCKALAADGQRAHRAHECVFDGLLAKRFVALQDPLDAETVPAVRALLEEQRVNAYALWLRASSARVYPAGELDAVGRWGWSDASDQREPVPLIGLERLANTLLERLEVASGVRLVRGAPADLVRRALIARRPGLQRGYYLAHDEREAPATVETTLDLDLVRYTGARLERALAESQAASAMAVVLDLDTREVLSLDWRDAYRTTLWSPLQRLFTPGSTWKVVTMALALEHGHVRPDEVFDVGHGLFLLRNEQGRVVRRIGEAEGFKHGLLTAAECLAHSSNAGMVQIGTRIPPETWKRWTRELGYGLPAAPELAGPLYNPPGRVGEPEGRGGRPWSLGRNLASVSFGDSISLNLLQHAAGLAALLGDGEWRPLRFVRAVHAAGRRFPLPEGERKRIVSERTHRLLVEMCRLGAEEGTGKTLERPELAQLGTKTGTTEKLRNDVCSHVWGKAYEEALESGAPWDDARMYRRYQGKWGDGRRSCYVSSIAAFATSPDGKRRCLALVVIDDPHAPGRPFGSRHAGPVAVDLLEEALGYTVGGEPPLVQLASGHWPMQVGTLNPSVLPWLERLDASFARFADAGAAALAGAGHVHATAGEGR